MADFYCDPAQLDYLIRNALPELIKSHGYGIVRKLVVWDAGCSHGEETYTLAMVLTEFANQFPGLCFDFVILATDSGPDELQLAERAVYDEESIHPVPMELRRKYFLRSKQKERRLIRMVPELRALVKFRRIDMTGRELKFRETIDLIFCRQLLWRVDREVRANLLRQFSRHLSPGGYLFLGKAEAPGDLVVPLLPVAPAVYRKPGEGSGFGDSRV
jgi:chemotaxis protein methyltransferase CheR